MKKITPVSALTTCCLVGLLFVSSNGALKTAKAAEGKNKMQSTQADFKEYCQMMQGRWIGEVIWITDWPGFGKKGDKVTGYEEWTIGEGGQVLQGRFYGGPGSGTALTHYDAGARKIQCRAVSSGGNVWNHVIYKKDGKWHFETTGSTATGKKITGSSIRHISDDGKTHRLTGTLKIDGKELDPLRDVFHRIGD